MKNESLCFHTKLAFGLLMGIAVALASWETPARAGERIKWRGVAGLVVTNTAPLEWMDNPDHSVGQLQMDGVIFTEVGGSFLDKARYQVLSQWDSAADPQFWGYKTFTEADGSQVFLRFEQPVQGVQPPRYVGNWTAIGGSGKYKGVKGQGTYAVTFISDATLWDILEGEFELP